MQKLVSKECTNTYPMLIVLMLFGIIADAALKAT